MLLFEFRRRQHLTPRQMVLTRYADVLPPVGEDIIIKGWQSGAGLAVPPFDRLLFFSRIKQGSHRQA